MNVIANDNLSTGISTISIYKRKYLSVSLLFSSLLLTACGLTSDEVAPDGANKSLPNVWAAKQIFAWSGLDGETSFSEPFTSVIIPEKLGFRIGNNDHYLSNLSAEQFIASRPLWLELEVAGNRYFSTENNSPQAFKIFEPGLVTSSAIQLKAEVSDIAMDVKLIYADRKTVLGQISLSVDGAEAPKLILKNQHASDPVWANNMLSYRSDKNESFLNVVADRVEHHDDEIVVSLQEGHQVIPFTYQLNYSDEFVAPDLGGKTFDSLYLKRKQSYQELSTGWIDDERVVRAYKKAYSIMRANTETAQGMIKFQWTTPDRTPHKKMWLWDSAFHGIGLANIDGDWARSAVKAILSTQREEDGFISISVTPEGFSDISQPPVLSWAIWEIYQRVPDREFLEYAYPKLQSYLEWFYVNRDANRNGLMEWYDGNESGMDNSPRFDDKERPFDAVDLNSFIVNEWKYLAKIAVTLGKVQDATEFEIRQAKLKEKLNSQLWHEPDQMYYDRFLDGEFSDSLAISSFLPLFAQIASAEQATALLNKYQEEKSFWTPFPAPSVSRQDPSFGTNMWRGPVWINYAYMQYLGLKNYQFDDEANYLLNTSIEQITHWYHKEGSIFEFYDPLNKTSPQQLPRKSSLGCIHEFGWSSSLFIDMVHLKYQNIEP